MQLNERTAAIDNDFVCHVVECSMPDQRLVEVLKIVFSELNLSAVMHPLVYEKELLQGNVRINLLFQSNVIRRAEFSDIFQDDPARKAYYIMLVKQLYFSLMGERIPDDVDILTYWVRRKSLGEVHSFAMCLLCGCGVFLSDDGDAKLLRDLLERSTLGTVNVYSRKEFIEKHMQEGESKFNRKERKALTHSASR